MTSIPSRLACRVANCMLYGSHFSIFGSREYYWYARIRNYATKPTNQLVYKTRLALPADYDRVLTFMNDAYFKHEPMIVNVGLCESTPPLLNLLHDHIREGMTIIAETQDDRVVGAAVNTGSCPWEPDELIELAERCEPGPTRDVIEFYAYVSGKPNLWQRYCVLKIFECSYLAVDPDFQCRGIARKLIVNSWCLARDCTYRLFRINCSSRHTAEIAKDFGWERICIIPFNQYVKDGELVFQNITEPHTEMQVYIDRVTYCKDYCPPFRCKKKSALKLYKEKLMSLKSRHQ